MNEPTSVVEAPENPKVMAGLNLDSEVVATHGGLSPPAGFDSLRSPITDDSVLATVPPERQRSPFRPGDGDFDRLWWRE
ncbi:MAG: hypothetical protein NT013_25595 [Planctomycetia bacterium]|nr:hypothetical protein [Planctomycetia bacterium]